ncbi:MAG: hypothetical protein NVSMB32_17820 [Actinomycetota bacterium]
MPPRGPLTGLDSEGNAVSNEGGRPHLTHVPAACPWHKGRAEALPANPEACFRALMAQCRAIKSRQDAYAALLRVDETVMDMKYWFARIYGYVTQFEMEQITAGVYDYPLMKMQELVVFGAIYRYNLDNWMAGNKAAVDQNWRVAFQAAGTSTVKGPLGWLQIILTLGTTSTRSQDVMNALLPSMEAHIRFDLPRAIAAAYGANYAGIPGLSVGLFRSDFEKMTVVFDRANEALSCEIDEYCARDVRPDPGSWHWLEKAGLPFVFDIPQARDQAWVKASEILSGKREGITDPAALQRRLEAAIAAGPGSAREAFEVGGRAVRDYPFGSLPPPG